MQSKRFDLCAALASSVHELWRGLLSEANCTLQVTKSHDSNAAVFYFGRGETWSLP